MGSLQLHSYYHQDTNGNGEWDQTMMPAKTFQLKLAKLQNLFFAVKQAKIAKSQNGLVCFFASLNHASIILLLSPTWESALTRSNWRASSRKTTVQDITAPERSRCCCMGHRRCITPSLPSIFCSLGNWHVKKAAGHPYFSSLRHAFTL